MAGASLLEIRKEFGTTVRAHRLRLGFSQERLAQRASLHRTYVTDVERGARNISLVSISRLAHALEVSISSLFIGSNALGSRPDETRGAGATASILLVDDDREDVRLALTAFREARLANQVQVVHDGEAALDFLFCQGRYARRQRSSPPAVILLELGLPRLHGLEVLKRVRADHRTRGSRIAVLTNERNNAEVRTALTLGADAYLVKPLDFYAFSSITSQLKFSWTLLHAPKRFSRPRKPGKTLLRS